MKVAVSQAQVHEILPDLLVAGLFEGETTPRELGVMYGHNFVKAEFEKLSLLHPDDPGRGLVVGLGKREDFEPERARVAAALVAKEAAKLEATSLAWLAARVR